MTAEAVRNEKRADELKVGDWIAAGPYGGDLDVTGDAEVLFIQPYGHGALALTIQEATIPQPEIIYLNADQQIPMLTDDEIVEAKASAARRQIAAELHELARLIGSGGLLLPVDSLSVNIAVETRAEVLAVAEPFGLPTAPWITTGLQVSWPKGRKSYEPGVRLLVYTSQDEPKPEPVADRCVASLHTPAPGITCGWCGAEGMRYAGHIEAGASASDTCSAECACGVEVSGFDSLDEARAELARHIADPDGLNYGRGDESGPEPVSKDPASRRVEPHNGEHVSKVADDAERPIPCGCGPEHGPQCPLGL